MTRDDQLAITAAVGQLAKTSRGRSTLRCILAWMDDDGLGLDGQNKEAAVSLIELCWKHPGSARDAVREVLGV